MVTGWNQTLVAVMKPSPSNGEKVVKQKRCRKGQKNSQGTSPKVREERLNEKIQDLKNRNMVLQENLNLSEKELALVRVERDSARTQLKISEKTSAQRFLLILHEVPNFARSLLGGYFDRYRASL